MAKVRERCPWAESDPLYTAYHDEEWGVPVRDDATVFEFLILEGMQAGLSWLTILRKRDNFRRAFANFDAQKIAKFGDRDVARLLDDPGIVRNRLKVAAAITNARLFLEMSAKHGSFARYLWSFVDDEPIVNHFRTLQEIPARTPVSDAISKELKKIGFKFVGSTIIYAHMQATGMVNDHLESCFRHRECMALGKKGGKREKRDMYTVRGT